MWHWTTFFLPVSNQQRHKKHVWVCIDNRHSLRRIRRKQNISLINAAPISFQMSPPNSQRYKLLPLIIRMQPQTRMEWAVRWCFKHFRLDFHALAKKFAILSDFLWSLGEISLNLCSLITFSLASECHDTLTWAQKRGRREFHNKCQLHILHQCWL